MLVNRMRNLQTKTMKISHKYFHFSIIPLGFCGGFILGLVALRIFDRPLPQLVFLLSAFAFYALSFCFKNFLRLFCAVIAGFLLGICRMSVVISNQKILAAYYDKEITLSGTLAKDSEFKDGANRLVINDLYLNDSTKSVKCQVYVMLAGTENYARSDRITLRGKLKSGFGDYDGFT